MQFQKISPGQNRKSRPKDSERIKPLVAGAETPATAENKERGMPGLFSHYGLTGQAVRVRRRAGESEACPWGYTEQKMRIKMETPYFLVAEVLPHRHPKGFGLSFPYLTTLHKHDIKTGDFIIKEVQKNEPQGNHCKTGSNRRDPFCHQRFTGRQA